MLVSILIPSLVERLPVFTPKLENLYKQIKDNNLEEKVEVIVITDNRTIALVEKRNTMQKLARGKYFTHLDDDDNFTEDYCKTVVEHIENLQEEVDIIAYDQKCFIKEEVWIVKPNMKSGLELRPIEIKEGVKIFDRFPWQFHLYNRRFLKVFRTESDSPDKINKPALYDDLNWCKKIQLEYPKSIYIIKDWIGHEYHFEDPSKTTTQ